MLQEKQKPTKKGHNLDFFESHTCQVSEEHTHLSQFSEKEGYFHGWQVVFLSKGWKCKRNIESSSGLRDNWNFPGPVTIRAH